ncbi:MAG TPA: ABC transporter ATP-binding protein [Spirochaetota bacterium]|mgnify:FL=1|nr:ABC transporter ATP-binding protein [Spirochaetota bacterium]
MKKQIKKSALTKSGKKGLVVASIGSFLSNLAHLAPIFIVMFFAQQIILKTDLSIPLYLGIIAGAGIVMYIFIDIGYDKTYNETYKEAVALRIDIANKLKELPLSYFSTHDVADLSQTVMQDVLDIGHALSHAIPQMFGAIAFSILVATGMIAFNPIMGLAIFTPIALSFVFLALSKGSQTRASKKYFDVLRENADAFQQAIEMHQEIKAFGQKESVQKDINKKIDHSEKIHIKSELAQAVPVILANIMLKFSLGACIFAGIQVFDFSQPLHLLYFLGYLMASVALPDAFATLHENIAEILYMDARLKRIAELRSVETQAGEPYDLKSFDVEFKGVEFSYKDGVKVIDGISFTAKQNTVTAFVGPSGCGKTTVLRLMSRLYDYDSGEITIDGKDIKTIDADSLFDKISIVFQDVMLFNTSVLENIRLGNRSAADEEVKKAAELANCTEFIEKLPEKYDTFIGENGAKLSGGERQRISIARAFLKNAPIIILDEISASLDVENEMAIQESLNKLLENRTVVIISHRLKSVENADKIIVMNEGKIDAKGSHDELLKSSELYRSLIEKSQATERFAY